MDLTARKHRIPEGYLRLSAKWALVGGSAVVIIAAAIVVLLQLYSRPVPINPPPGWVALPHHVRVEVLNASNVPGAARIGRLALQHAGLDVVQSGNADSALRGNSANRILVRLGDTAGVGRIIEVLGSAEIEMKADRTRIVDLTVVLGSKFVPPIDRFNASQ